MTAPNFSDLLGIPPGMHDSRTQRSEVGLPPSERATTEAEYALWRSSADAAWGARRNLIPVEPATVGTTLARETNQALGHFATAYLRNPETIARLFGRPGRLTSLRRYTVPGRWEVRADAVFTPADGSPATLVGFVPRVSLPDSSAASATPEAELYHLAYQRFTMRQGGHSVESCATLTLQYADVSALAAFNRDGAQALEEVFVYRDVTDEIAAPNGGPVGSIGGRVAVDATEVTPFLQRDNVPMDPEALAAHRLPRPTGRRDGLGVDGDQTAAVMTALGYDEERRALLARR